MAYYSHKDTHSPHIPTHNIVSSHREDRLFISHLSLAFPTPGVLAFAFGNTGGPYLQSACLRRITSSRSPTPELGRGGFLGGIPQATLGQEDVFPLGIWMETADASSTYSANVFPDMDS